jgi:CBS domain-containing protein
METLGDILKEKGRVVFTTTPEATVIEAVEMMAAKRVGALLVCVDEAPVGILSERDVMMRVILARKDPVKTTVEDVMTSDVICAEPTTRGEEAMAIMTDRRVRHLPVVSNGRVQGVISIGDLVRCATRAQEFEIRMLTDYVSSGTLPGITASPYAAR